MRKTTPYRQRVTSSLNSRTKQYAEKARAATLWASSGSNFIILPAPNGHVCKSCKTIHIKQDHKLEYIITASSWTTAFFTQRSSCNLRYTFFYALRIFGWNSVWIVKLICLQSKILDWRPSYFLAGSSYASSSSRLLLAWNGIFEDDFK